MPLAGSGFPDEVHVVRNDLSPSGGQTDHTGESLSAGWALYGHLD